MFCAIELGINDVSQHGRGWEHHEMRTSLTGIEETPISIAMNQPALIRKLAAYF
jgi:hypothetical protein